MKLFFSLIFLFTAVCSLQELSAQNNSKLEVKAARIHAEAFTVDSHTDAPLNFINKRFDIAKDNSTTMIRSCVDFPRMQKGGLDAVFFAVFTSQGPRTPEANAKIKVKAETIFDSIDDATVLGAIRKNA